MEDLIQSLAAEAPAVDRRAYSYVRFSTPEQRKGDSLRRQVEMAQRYAIAHGLELDETLTFHDVGKSAYRGLNAEAGQLAVFMEAVAAGQVPSGSVLLVEQLDRLSRMKPRKALRVLEDIVEAGVSVVTLNDGREYTAESLDAMDLIASVLIFMRANEESEAKSQRCGAAWDQKRRNIANRPLTATTPEWVRLNRDTGKLELIEERAEVVRRVFRMALAGIGVQGIAATFNREGLETWGRGRRKAKLWHRSYILRMIENPAVKGAFTPHRGHYEGGRFTRVPLETVPDYFPQVIDANTFERVNAAKRGRAARVNVPRARFTAKNLLAGMTICPKCGSSMVRVMKGTKSRPALVCTLAKNGKGCRYRSVRYDYVESRLLLVLPKALRDRDGLSPADDGLEDRLANAESVYVDLCERVELLVADLVAEVNPNARSVLLAQIRPMAEARKEAQEQLRLLREQLEQTAGAVLRQRIEKAIAALHETEAGELDRAAANAALRTIFDRAVINYPEGTIDLVWKAGGTLRVHYALREPEPYRPGDYVTGPRAQRA